MHVHKEVGHFTPGCQTNVKLLKLEKRNFREKHYQDKKIIERCAFDVFSKDENFSCVTNYVAFSP